MGRNLEARIERLEAAQGVETIGIESGRFFAKVLGYTGDELEAKAKEMADTPRRSHEEWVDLMSQQAKASCDLISEGAYGFGASVPARASNLNCAVNASGLFRSMSALVAKQSRSILRGRV